MRDPMRAHRLDVLSWKVVDAVRAYGGRAYVASVARDLRVSRADVKAAAAMRPELTASVHTRPQAHARNWRVRLATLTLNKEACDGHRNG